MAHHIFEPGSSKVVSFKQGDTMSVVDDILPISEQAVFNRCADATLNKARRIYQERNDSYRDAMHDDNLITTFTLAALRAIALKNDAEEVINSLSVAELRLIQLGAIIDIKDARMHGYFKADTVIDGINYRAVFTTLMEEYLKD